tara:strand:+ start:2679 stop:2975 length:297 start_codon:yes stop_codon:yes gene_type:complete
MENQNDSPCKRQNKDKHFKAQSRLVLQALKVKPMTMKEVDVYTGIMRENICRHISELMTLGLIAIIRKRRCSITGHPNVNEYSGDSNFFPKSNQLELF